jgi:hypothetical protein
MRSFRTKVGNIRFAFAKMKIASSHYLWNARRVAIIVANNTPDDDPFSSLVAWQKLITSKLLVII